MFRPVLYRRAIYPALRVGARRYPCSQGRFTSTAPSPRPFLYRTRQFLRWTGYTAASTVLGVTLITGAIFVHDAFTYTEAHVDKVPVSPLALFPETGGPKDLPVVSAFLSDIEDPENERISHKPRLVVVGGGWGVCGPHSGFVIQNKSQFLPGSWTTQQTFPWRLSCYAYFSRHVHNVHSPPPLHVFILYFLSISLTSLTAAAVGTVQVRSLIEPLRKIIARLEGHFISGKAVDLVMSERLLEVEVIGPDGQTKSIYVP